MRTYIQISIIVPCWNVAPYLACAMDSLLGQTLRNIEIICIDDKSEDDSLAILRECEKRDARVKVIAFEENQGVSVARNEGMKVATGEYIGFLDADDCVDRDFYEKLYDRAVATQADIVKGNAKVVGLDGKVKSFGSTKSKILENKACFHYPFWCAIYKREFLESYAIDFPEGIIVIQDTVFLLKAVMQASILEVVDNDSCYVYQRREGSLNSMKLTEAKIKSNIVALNRMADFLNEIDLDRKIYNRSFSEMISDLCSMFKRNNQIKIRIMIVEEAIELFRKCKYADDYIEQYPMGDFLRRGDEIGLFFHLLKNRKRKFKLFGFITILEIRNKRDCQIWRLFGFLSIYKKHASQTYKLFGIPFLVEV